MDRWDIWLQYIESVLHLENGLKEVNKECNGISETETPDDTFEKAHEFICRIVETGSGNSTLFSHVFDFNFTCTLFLV